MNEDGIRILNPDLEPIWWGFHTALFGALVALGIARRGGLDRWSLGLIAVSLAVNHWGVTWGNMLGW